MLKNSNITLSKIFADIFKDIVFFPFWWYSLGLAKIVKGLAGFVAGKEKSLALIVWIKNIFVPMYGQRDIQGAIISFFVRLIQIIFRSLILLFWVIIALIIFWLWLLSPILIIYMIVLQF
ncbi:MAG: hypothetical protein PHO56_02520 [Patescibacteria group bacterium]|nr:hypothetical protein [Patescibacteria group bacterium]